jgi:membrane-bound lytic murein transglycosylase D
MLNMNLTAPGRGAHRIFVWLFLTLCQFMTPNLQAQDKLDPCEPQFAQKLNEALIHHLRCPETAARDIPLTGHFTIPSSLHARVRFWHHVFTRQSVKDYAIHLSDHPHLVLEIVSFPWLGAEGNLDSRARRMLKIRHQYYKQLFKRMDQGKILANENLEADRLRTLLKQIPRKVRFASLDLRNQKGQREFMHRGIEMASPYLKHVEQEFENLSTPPELALLAFVESTFNLNAISKVKASGVYQIMPFIARQYMRLTAAIDERLDPIKSAAVAARLLKDNYELLGSWPLAITAYNHGPYGIKRAVKKAGSTDIAVLIDSYEGRGFGFASQNFYAEFLAIVYAMKNADEHFPEAKLASSLDFRNEKLEKPMRIRDVSRQFGVSLDILQRLNPDLSRGFVKQNGLLPRHFTIKIPNEPANFTEASLGRTL